MSDPIQWYRIYQQYLPKNDPRKNSDPRRIIERHLLQETPEMTQSPDHTRSVQILGPGEQMCKSCPASAQIGAFVNHDPVVRFTRHKAGPGRVHDRVHFNALAWRTFDLREGMQYGIRVLVTDLGPTLFFQHVRRAFPTPMSPCKLGLYRLHRRGDKPHRINPGSEESAGFLRNNTKLEPMLLLQERPGLIDKWSVLRQMEGRKHVLFVPLHELKPIPTDDPGRLVRPSDRWVDSEDDPFDAGRYVRHLKLSSADQQTLGPL